MKRKYEVRWYELNLTQPRSRKFFTKKGALLFMCYLETFEHVQPVIYRNDTDSN